MARIAVIGPGAIGGTIAAWLGQDPRHEVIVCARSGLETLELIHPDGVLVQRPVVLRDPAAAGPVDWALAAVKTYDSEAAAAWLGALLSKGGRLGVLQNGVEQRARFGAFVDEEQITPAVVDIPAERTGPGRIRQRRFGALTAPAGPAGDDFAALFAATPIAATTTTDFTSALWAKLAINAAGAAPAALRLAGAPQDSPELAPLAEALARETIAVGEAEGAKLDAAALLARVRASMQPPRTSRNSLELDLAAGRPTEIDARNGVVVRRGLAHGLETPNNRQIVALLTEANGSALAV
jgi:2-dehydropantoate 2-reductase